MVQTSTEHSTPKIKPSQSVDLVEILERDVYPHLTPEQVYNWAGHDFKRSGNRLRGNPPWGQSKSGTSFTAFDDLGFLDSHNGGETGDPIKYRYSLKTGAYAYPKGKDWIETVKELFNLAGVTFPEREWTSQQIKDAQRRESRQAILQAVQDYCADILWTARGEAERKHLIEERGFTSQWLKDFGIGLYPTVKEIKQVLQAKKLEIELAQQIGVLAKKWEGYMIFPWANSYGQPLTLYGHQSKVWAEATGKPKKYALFNPKDEQGAWLHTKESPYFLDRAIRERHKELVLVEGITDAAIAHQQGDTRVIACVAAMLSKQQCETLKRHRIERVIIALDPDAAGDAGIDSCIKSLSEVDISTYVAPKLPCGLDPDEYILEYGIDTWKALTKAAIHGYRWKAERILESGDLTTDSGKEAVLSRAIAYAYSKEDTLSLELHFLPTIAGGLGMDIEALRKALERQVNGKAGGEDDWEDDAPEGKPKRAKIPGQDKIAFELIEQYRPSLAWHSGIKSWLRYEEDKGIWDEATEESIKRAIATHLYSLPDNPDFSSNYVDGIAKLIKAQLEVTDWDEQRDLIPMQDGVLNAATLELLPHAPGYRFLWQLPYKWTDRTLGCQPIHAWIIKVARGDQQVVQLLRAYLKAVVTGRTDLQKLLELIGAGGSGKGTYSRLAQALVGAENTGVTTLKQLEENRFETAGLFGKRLLLITDSERYGGDVSTLKAITGGDAIRYEKKNVQQTKPYTPTYMVIISANETIQSADYTSGMARRRITVPFNLQVADSDRRDLDAEFKPYLAGCLEWVLSLPDDEMVSLIRNTGESVFASKDWKIEALLDTNPLADWFDSCCCIAPGQKNYVGGLNDRPDLKLYPSYSNYVQNAGCKPVAMRRFSKLLVDLASSQLGYKSVRKLPKNEFGVAIADVILRDDSCSGYPRPISGNRDNPPHPPNGGGGGNKPKPPTPPNTPVAGGLPVKSKNLPVNLPDETRTADGFDVSDGFFESGLSNEIFECSDKNVATALLATPVAAEVKSDLPSVPSNPSATGVSSGSQSGSQHEVYRQPVQQVELPIYQRSDGGFGIAQSEAAEEVEEAAAFSFEEEVESIAGVLADEATSGETNPETTAPTPNPVTCDNSRFLERGDEFKKGDWVMTPEGKGYVVWVVWVDNACEYIVRLPKSTPYFKPCKLSPLPVVEESSEGAAQSTSEKIGVRPKAKIPVIIPTPKKPQREQLDAILEAESVDFPF
jgi:putative DNA primase/helicase